MLALDQSSQSRVRKGDAHRNGERLEKRCVRSLRQMTSISRHTQPLSFLQELWPSVANQGASHSLTTGRLTGTYLHRLG